MFKVRVPYLGSTLKTFKVTQQPLKEQSPTSMPVPKDRAGKLEVQQNARVEALLRAGNFEAKISRKWQCFDPTCRDSQMPIRKEKKTVQETMMEVMEMQAPPPQPPSYLPQQISSTCPTSSYRPVPCQQSPPPKSSSLIAQDEDEIDTILRFFDKRIHATVNIECRAKLEAARDVIFIHNWSISDLQTMADTKGEMYDCAIRAGVSDGMVRGFKRDLARFKSEERREEEERIVAQTLTNLMGGGFLLNT
ncbi:MAG: hypothetical protein M1839_005933 [Geoglossum umbratile]|nr:MAG: hypothetical protein M1839_005933 [Geoglossum umbratile]